MAAAAHTADSGDAPKKSKKMLFIIVGAVLLLAIAGGAAFMLLGKKADDGEGADGGEHAEAPAKEHKKPAKAAHDPKHPPAFLAMETFTVNLADKDRDRYLQAGITLQLEEEHAGEEIKSYTPALRYQVLLVLSSLTSAAVADTEGKELVAHRLQNTINKTLGYAPPPRKKRKGAHAEDPVDEEEEDIEGPVTGVNFTTFVIQ